MVFISLEGFVGASAASSSATQRLHYQLPMSAMHPSMVSSSASTSASLHVIVTPGSPVKKSANDALLRSRFSFRSSSASGTGGATPFLLYVTDSAVNSKWVLTKTASEYQELRKLTQQAIGACNKFSCCGPLRRIAKSALYKSQRKKWSDSSVASQYGLAGVVQEYVNDLLLAIFAREHQCESTNGARRVLERFLDIASHRAAAADRVMHMATSLSSSSRDADGDEELPSRSRQHSDPTSSHDDSECPICCADLSDEQTLQLPCSHVYHAACVRVWLNMQHTCPVCRVPLETAGSDK
ncbi:Ring-h2 finger protein atl34 [Globisporangium polare]